MYKFSKLFLKNSLITLLFLSVFVLCAFLLLKSSLEEQSKQQQGTIHSIIQQFKASRVSEKTEKTEQKNNAIQLANLLKKIDSYQSLIIKNNSHSLVNYKSKAHSSFDLITPDAKVVLDKELAISLEYQVDFSNQIILIIRLTTALLLLSILFIILSSWLNYKLQNIIFNSISRKIRNDLSQINDPEGHHNTTSDHLLEIPALTEGVAEIKSLLSEQIKSSSSLAIEAYIDHLTGLENRNRFVQFYESQVTQDSPVNFGVLLITRCSELQTINKIHGYTEGDNYIKKVASLIQDTVRTHQQGQLFRLNSSDFATLLPNAQLKQAESYAEELTQRFNGYQLTNDDIDSVAYTGLVFFDKSRTLGELLAFADTGVSVAQTKNVNSWHSLKNSDILNNSNINTDNQNWREEIESVIENQRISLLLQPILPSGRNNKVYGEILARFLNSTDDMLPTASFIAMAEKLDKIVEVDKLVIDTTINEIINKNMIEHSYGINISARSINDQHFMIWLERKLLREPSAATRLVFEISEFGLQQNIQTGKRLIDMLHRAGARVTVERFGVGLTSFKFFRDLTPDYIKMDSSYTRDIDDDKNNQYFLRLMVDLAHRLGVSVLAESVETQEEKHTLEKLFIDGCQGFYIGKPAPL